MHARSATSSSAQLMLLPSRITTHTLNAETTASRRLKSADNFVNEGLLASGAES